MNKIYLTYKQIETLCFSRITSIPEKQLSINRSRKFYEFAVYIDDDKIIKENINIVLLFSSITKIEIPKSEFNLFKNQFKLPLGLLVLADRKVPKDSDEEINAFTIEDNVLKLYSRLRRSFTQLVLFGYKHNSSEIRNSLSEFLNKITDLSTFESSLIKTINDEGHFPQHVVKDIKPEEYYKYIWWGKFAIDTTLTPQEGNLSQEEIQSHKTWLRNIEWDKLTDNRKNFKSIPSLFNGNYGVMLGYFLASLSSSNIDKKNIGNEVDSILTKIRDVDKEFEILFWGVLLQAFFVEELDYSYPSPLIQDDFYKMEKLSLSLAESLLKESNQDIKCGFSFKNINSDELVVNFEKLKEENIKVDPIILREFELTKPFNDAPLFRKNKNRIGFINKQISDANYLMVNKEGFEIKSKSTNPPVVYYGSLSKEDKEVLKKNGINIKNKDLSTLISKESKVIVAFLPSYMSNNPLLEVYKSIVKSKKAKIEEFIFVWLVSRDNIILHSPEFALEKDKLKEMIELDFGLKTTVIVKNLINNSIGDVEVIRNLRLALKDYKTKNIEIIDHNFKDEYASWIIEATNDYIVKSDKVDYFTFWT